MPHVLSRPDGGHSWCGLLEERGVGGKGRQECPRNFDLINLEENILTIVNQIPFGRD